MEEREETQGEVIGSTGKFHHHLSSGEPLNVMGKGHRRHGDIDKMFSLTYEKVIWFCGEQSQPVYV